MQTLHSILGIHWQDCVSNLEVFDHMEPTSIESLITQMQ